MLWLRGVPQAVRLVHGYVVLVIDLVNALTLLVTRDQVVIPFVELGALEVATKHRRTQIEPKLLTGVR